MLKLSIEYGEIIIVAVVRNGTCSWYVTEKDYWFLDLVKLERAYADKGYSLPNAGDYSSRYHIAILDEKSAETFLEKIKDYQVSTNELRDMLQKVVSEHTRYENELMELAPSLFVDFDNRQLLSSFPEPASFEHFVPDGWVGEYNDFLDKIPLEQRYWVVAGEDHFQQ